MKSFQFFYDATCNSDYWVLFSTEYTGGGFIISSPPPSSFCINSLIFEFGFYFVFISFGITNFFPLPKNQMYSMHVD